MNAQVHGRDAKPWIASEFTVNPYGILRSACKVIGKFPAWSNGRAGQVTANPVPGNFVMQSDSTAMGLLPDCQQHILYPLKPPQIAGFYWRFERISAIRRRSFRGMSLGSAPSVLLLSRPALTQRWRSAPDRRSSCCWGRLPTW